MPVAKNVPSSRPRGGKSVGHRWRTTQLKLRLVFIPYLSYATGFPALYTLANWILVSSTVVPPINDDVRNLFLPLFLPWFPILLHLRNRIKILRWPRNNDPFLGYMLAWVCIAIPTLFLQDYVEAAAGEHAQLGRISQITAKPISKYYTVGIAHVDKEQARSWISTALTGRQSSNWQIKVHYVMPLVDTKGDTNAVDSPTWLGVVYQKTVSSSLSEKERHDALDDFALQTSQKLNRDDFGWISYYSIVGKNEDRRGLESAWKQGAAKMHEPPRFLLEAHPGPFEARTGNTLSLFLATYGFAASLWLLLALGMKIDAPTLRRWHNRVPPANSDLKAAWQFAIPRTNFFFTPLLLHINLLVWLFLVFRGQGLDAVSGRELLAWGALYAPAVHEGELWRLITFLFVHADIMHLANNMISLAIVGFLVERSFGRWWFVAVYFATGFAGAAAGLLWKPTVIVVGASGAIFGVAGFGLALLLLKRQRFTFERPLLLKAAALYFGINLLMGALLPHVDLVGHVAGLVGGIVIGLVSSSLITDPPAKQ